jgi:hypothetical protein
MVALVQVDKERTHPLHTFVRNGGRRSPGLHMLGDGARFQLTVGDSAHFQQREATALAFIAWLKRYCSGHCGRPVPYCSGHCGRPVPCPTVRPVSSAGVY